MTRSARHWSPTDQKTLSALDRRAREAEEDGKDTIDVAPEDLLWALGWITDLLEQ